jgi:hypothetical protein
MEVALEKTNVSNSLVIAIAMALPAATIAERTRAGLSR